MRFLLCLIDKMMRSGFILELTEQDDDANKYCNDGPSAQSSSCYSSSGTAVPIVITRAHLDSDQRAIGQRRVSRVRNNDRDLVHTCFQVRNS